MKNRRQTVVVTGGAGFIGSHLVDRLISDGHTVVVVDNFSTGRFDNLRHLNNEPLLSVQEMDLTSYEKVRKVVSQADWVFHLAALADIVPSIERPLDYHKANIDGTVKLLEACRAGSVKRFIYAASSSCYGLAKSVPTSETEPILPMYPYALTKYIGEQYVLHWNQVYGLPSVSLRLFNVYGPRSRTSGTYGAVFGVFLAQKLAGKPFTVVGDGSQTRDFTFVTDVVEAFIKACQSDVKHEVFNVGSGGTYSINRLVELLGGCVVNIPERPGEPKCTFADISKITNVLEWHPRISFESGIEIMLDNIDDWTDAPVWEKNDIVDATASWFKYLDR